MLSISNGNTKIGSTPNFSLTPGFSCLDKSGKFPPCYRAGCYAANCFKRWKNVQKSWASNFATASRDAFEVLVQVRHWLAKHPKTKYFRIHVGGDFFSQDYVKAWTRIARRTPDVRFLAFTRRTDLDFSKVPRNLKIVYSMWLRDPKEIVKGPRAWVHEPSRPDKRIPKGAFQCPGSCKTCRFCWHMTAKQSVCFESH
jgi:hypothetical protein